MSRLKPGDTVMLKSGGPIMTIEQVLDKDRAACQWFDNGKLSHGVFPLVSLALEDEDV